jgi:hypothetical protein
MLVAPDASLGPAGQPTHRRIELLADWIELAALADDVELYRHDVVGVLKDSYFVKDQDDAQSAVAQAWRVLQRRQRTAGSAYPFDLNDDYILQDRPKDRSAYCFMLVLAATEYLSGYRFGSGGAFRNLFEIMCVEAVSRLLPGWEVSWCGATAQDMRAAGGIVPYVARLLRTQVKDPTFFKSAQDGGVDFLAVWTGADQRSARPALWGQVASGQDWDSKLKEPDFDLWMDAIRVLPAPARAFAVPFAFDQHTFTFAAIKSTGWILDRERLAAALPKPSDAKLEKSISEWLDTQLKRLPSADLA